MEAWVLIETYRLNGWQRLRRTLAFARRLAQTDDPLGRQLFDLAQRERRPLDVVAADLLAIALERRRAAEINLQRWEALSAREQQVTALVCLNHTNATIAERLVISPETVKTHVRNVLYKFNLHSKAELRYMLADWDFSAYAEADLRGY
jgi:DNA-binding CsgD family transcriptional regulator